MEVTVVTEQQARDSGHKLQLLSESGTMIRLGLATAGLGVAAAGVPIFSFTSKATGRIRFRHRIMIGFTMFYLTSGLGIWLNNTFGSG